MNEKKLEFDKQYCIFIDKSKIWKPKNIQENIEKMLKFYKIIPIYNEMTKNLDVTIPDKFFTQDNCEELTLQFIYNLGLKHNFTGLNKDLIKSMILDVGDRYKYNPAKKYLDESYEKHKTYIQTNGISELKKLEETLETPLFDLNLKNMLIKKWLISCAEAVYCERGIASQGVLLLQSEQGDGKTTWFKNLFPNKNWFGEGLTLDPSNKDSVSKAVGYWVCELGEIGATLKKDLDILKSYITNSVDVFRKPFAKGTSNFPRRTIFCGTVNNKNFLKDDTGNRRFWVIPVKSVNANHNLNLEKLWAEVVYLKNKGETWWLNRDELKALNESNRTFEEKNYIDTLIEALFDWTKNDRYWLKSSDIFLELGAGKELSATKIGTSLKKRKIEDKLLNGCSYYKMPKTKNHSKWEYKMVAEKT